MQLLSLVAFLFHGQPGPTAMLFYGRDATRSLSVPLHEIGAPIDIAYHEKWKQIIVVTSLGDGLHLRSWSTSGTTKMRDFKLPDGSKPISILHIVGDELRVVTLRKGQEYLVIVRGLAANQAESVPLSVSYEQYDESLDARSVARVRDIRTKLGWIPPPMPLQHYSQQAMIKHAQANARYIEESFASLPDYSKLAFGWYAADSFLRIAVRKRNGRYFEADLRSLVQKAVGISSGIRLISMDINSNSALLGVTSERLGVTSAFVIWINLSPEQVSLGRISGGWLARRIGQFVGSLPSLSMKLIA